MLQTSVFRQPELMAYLEEYLLPVLLQRLQQKRDDQWSMRLWSAGCQNGDEFIPPALLLHTLLGDEAAHWRITLFVTDADPAQVMQARRHSYRELPSGGTDQRDWDGSFEAMQQGYRLGKHLREQIIFASHDLLSRPPFPHLDLIMCHHSLSILTPEQQRRVLARFAYALSPDGYLLLLSPGAVLPQSVYYQRIDGPSSCWQVYRRTMTPVVLGELGWATPGPDLPVPVPPVADDAIDTYIEELQATGEEWETTCHELEQRLQELEAATQQELYQKNQALAQANRHLEALAIQDPLTGLLNHRALIAVLDQELKRCHHNDRPCSLLFLDLDHFKAINDNYGHHIGDMVLSEFAAMAGSHLRGMETLGRWGGEEFLAILPEIDCEEALDCAQGIRAAIAAHTFSVGGGLRLTCSVGVATYPCDACEREGLISAADRGMYGAKKLGRNQVHHANEQVILALETERLDSPEEAALTGTVEALWTLVETRDPSTGQHLLRVGTLSTQLALALGITALEASMIGLAGRLHDVGKFVIPDTTLYKPGPLSAQEWVLMRKHPAIGAEVVSSIPFLRAIVPIIRAHHECWDGSGYPDHLSGEEIPLGARIVAVVDAYDAMTTSRPYQQARESAWALKEVLRCAGTQFDPRVVEVFEQALRMRLLQP